MNERQVIWSVFFTSFLSFCMGFYCGQSNKEIVTVREGQRPALSQDSGSNPCGAEKIRDELVDNGEE